MTAGSTFVGQFTDHDITFDQTSQLGVPQNPLTSPNTRTPALDLDSVFGGGPGQRPDLYVNNPDGTVGPQLKIGSGADACTNARGRPQGGQRRRQLQRAVGRPARRRERHDRGAALRRTSCSTTGYWTICRSSTSARFPAARAGERSNPYVAFLIARQVTLWHYQWLLVNEHLPQIAGQADRQRRAPERQPLL